MLSICIEILDHYKYGILVFKITYSIFSENDGMPSGNFQIELTNDDVKFVVIHCYSNRFMMTY